jgi:curved DNA-binding protein CbpA
VHARLTREEALRVLDLPPAVDAGEVKRAYRRLAREHHPDRGGDPYVFHELQRAYERLRDEQEAGGGPRISRGRPSRAPSAPVAEVPRVDLTSVDWGVQLPATESTLDRDRAAVWLAAGSGPGVRPLVAASRAPGSRVNRLASKLANDLTSRLTIAADTDDRGKDAVVIEVRASNRRARRHLDAAALEGRWIRTRGSSTTWLRSRVPPDDDRRVTATRALDRLEPLLDGLAWPLDSWTLTQDGVQARPVPHAEA